MSLKAFVYLPIFINNGWVLYVALNSMSKSPFFVFESSPFGSSLQAKKLSERRTWRRKIVVFFMVLYVWVSNQIILQLLDFKVVVCFLGLCLILQLCLVVVFNQFRSLYSNV